MNKSEVFLKGEYARKKNPVKIFSGTCKTRDPISVIKFNEQGRDAGLLEIRHEKMRKSLFGYLRGTAQIQAFDLAAFASTGIKVQCAGDAHIQNFEGYLYSHNTLCFDITDFDETYTAPFEWDLKRFALSIIAAARQNNISDSDSADVVINAMDEYRNWIMENYDCSYMDNWYKAVTMPLEGKIKPAKLFQFEKNITHNMVKEGKDKAYTIKDKKDKISHIKNSEEKNNLLKFINNYGERLPAEGSYVFNKMQLMDVAHKTSGVGSIGLKKYMALFRVNETHLIVLEIKEERKSVLEIAQNKDASKNNGERIFCAQRILRTTYDLFANWGTMADGKHFYVRRLLNTKLGIDVDNITKKSLNIFASHCGKVLALYHVKTIDPAFLAGYITKTKSLEKDIAKYSILYCNQLEKDYNLFCEAIKKGKFI
jgi:uncharacterized protein (DUF2252 family)